MKSLRKGLFGTIIMFVFSSSIAIAATGKPYSDQWVEGRIQGALAYNSYLDSTDVLVSMTEGVVTLTGTVPSDTERDLAQQIAESVDGVSSVNNRIEVDPDLIPRSRPEWLHKVTDATTTAAVKLRLLTNRNMHDIDIRVLTKDGVVSLTGRVSSMAQKELANQIALNTREVQEVQNDLTISDPSTLSEKANNASVNVSRAVSDSWITSRIRTSLIFGSDFPGSSVRVNTSKGKVTLAGYARSAAQRTEIAASVNEFVGVREVQNDLKVRN